MEEILASIRRIISDDTTFNGLQTTLRKDQKGIETSGMEDVSNVLDDDILELTEEVLSEEPESSKKAETADLIDIDESILRFGETLSRQDDEQPVDSVSEPAANLLQSHSCPGEPLDDSSCESDTEGVLMLVPQDAELEDRNSISQGSFSPRNDARMNAGIAAGDDFSDLPEPEEPKDLVMCLATEASSDCESAVTSGSDEFLDDHLSSSETDLSVRSSLDFLEQFVRSYDLKELRGIVPEILRPMLKEWLNCNLPQIVEDIVKKEVKRIIEGRQ
ncbi:MAG: DUF2497 domain-containing protein [Alphaproteobacteria bacterium]|nr:DUF2497 domain-containing protein [Alphaproteobacteria bacterium]